MSEYWFLHCNTCDVSAEDEINHGQEILRDVMTIASLVKIIRQRDRQGYVEITLMAHGSSHIDFAVEHLGHDVVLLSEYGRTEPIYKERWWQGFYTVFGQRCVYSSDSQEAVIAFFASADLPWADSREPDRHIVALVDPDGTVHEKDEVKAWVSAYVEQKTTELQVHDQQREQADNGPTFVEFRGEQWEEV